MRPARMVLPATCSLTVTLAHAPQDGQVRIVPNRSICVPPCLLVRMRLLAPRPLTITHVPASKDGWGITVRWKSMIALCIHPVKMVRLVTCSLTITLALACQVTLIATARLSLTIAWYPPILVRMGPLARME